MHRGRTAFAHTFGAAVAVRRRRCRVAVPDVRNIHGGDRSVITEGAGHHIAYCVIDTGFHECCADAVRGRAIDLAFDDRRIDDRAAIIYGHAFENLRDKTITVLLHDPA